MAAKRTLTVEILGDAKGAMGAFGTIQKGTQNLGAQFVDFGKKAALAFAGIAAGAVTIGKSLVTAASDLNENLSKTEVVFGDAADAVIDFSKKAATAFGQSQNQALEAAGNLGIFGKAAGLTGDDLSSFTTDLIGLASDMASFSNTTPQEAIDALGAALRGEAEPIRKYGVLLNDAALKAKAAEMGIYDGSEALTAQQKILAANALIFEQTTDAQGDFARTSGGLANQQRILAARIDNLKTRLGTALLPIALKVAQAFGTLIDKVGPLAEKWIPKLRDIFADLVNRIKPIVIAIKNDLEPILAKIIGWMKDNTDVVKVFFGVIAGAAVIAAIVAMAAAVASLFNPITLVIGAIAAVAAGVYYAYQRFEGFRDIVDKVARFFTETVVPALVEAWPKITEAVGKFVDFFKDTIIPALATGWDLVRDAISAFIDFFRERMDNIKAAMVNIQEFFVGVLDFIGLLWEKFGDTIKGFVTRAFDAIKTIIEGVIQTIKGIIDVFLGVLSGDWGRAWDGIKNIVGGALGTAIGLVKAAVNPIIAAFDVIKIGVGAALGVMRDTVINILTIIRNTFSTIFGTVFNIVSDVFRRIVNTVKSMLSGVINFFVDAINKLIGVINTAIRAYNKIPLAPDISTISPVPRVQLAKGGIVTGPTIALVGEAGPEMVVPLTGPYVPDFMQPSTGGDTYITVQVDAGLVSSPDQVGQQIIEAIRRAERRSGQVFAGV